MSSMLKPRFNPQKKASTTMNISAEIDIDNRPTIKDILKKVEEVKEEAAKDPGASLKSLSL